MEERSQLLATLDRFLEWPMLLLGIAWLVLLVVDLARGLAPWMEVAVTAIWIAFILDFTLKFSLAPRKARYLRSNWLTVIALIVPAFRVFRALTAFRLLRFARAARGLRLVRVIAGVNRGMRSLAASMSRRGVGFATLLTLLVTLTGAAGMMAFERGSAGPGMFESYGSALWWTAMIMTTMGSESWPATPEGRFLCLLLSLYAFAVFGYVTAAIASFFVEREAASAESDVASASLIRELQAEVRSLREMIESRGEGGRK